MTTQTGTEAKPTTLDEVRAIAFAKNSILNSGLAESVTIRAAWGDCKVYPDGSIKDAR